jgi:NitT/TauT family transport system permease protein
MPMTASESDLSLPMASAPPVTASARTRRRKNRRASTFWRVREDIPRRLELGLLGLSLLIPLLAWTVLDLSGTVNPIFLASPVETVEAGYEMLSSGDLSRDTSASVQRVFIGFSIAVLVSVPLGLAIGTFRSIRALFEPAIGLVRYAPATAFTPLLLIWLGIGEEPKVALVFIGTVFFNTLMTANVVWQVPSELIKVSLTLGAGSAGVFRKVIFPYAVPGMIDSARVNLAAAWNLIVVAELIAAEDGLGRRIISAQKFFHVDQIFVAIAVIGILGVTCDIGLRLLRNRIAPWSQE